ncbi:MAG TPA: ArsI/CadI family heavy metal resistance metalloenzyme [Aquabacterium sp.]|nr:ArsI/CadI family heavy metal resistance metalloenzyme [Aquabacterium sp.]
MKRFHVHVHVDDLARNIDFYSKMFGVQPARVESDYAKWMLDDPAVNFAISTRGNGHVGLDHLGIQVDSDSDLAQLKAQAQAADLALIDEGATTCCYARSDKHWVVDPQGVPWEHFRTLGTIPTFRESPDLAQEAGVTASSPEASACCTPTPRVKGAPIPIKQAGSGCC